MTISFQYIDTTPDLEMVVARCRRVAAVSIDTEFARSHTYYPEVGLIQIYDGETCFLIDPLVIDELSSLADLLEDKRVLKIFHACSEDMEVFQYAIGTLPLPVFDTQIAAAILGDGFSMSYQKLVEKYLSLNVPKEETRSDWLQRPLSDAQLDYAALDVIYLLQVYERQQAALVASGRLAWVEEECALLGIDVATSIDPGNVYLRVRAAARMSPPELNRLQALCAWRELCARRLNLPRNRVVEEKALVALVRTRDPDRETLASAGLTPRQIRKYGDDIMEVLQSASLADAGSFPPSLDEEPVSNDRIKRLKQLVDQQAEALSIAPEMLVRRRQLEELLRSNNGGSGFELPAALQGWRREVIGDRLLRAVEQD
ncbi:MAG: ribonuclease D [Pseudomonadota bacterium]